MTVLPRFDYCLVCDLIRPETNGKVILLGFIGVCPHVDLSIANLDQPTVLTFLIAGGPGDGQFTAAVAVVDDADERLVAQTSPGPFTAMPESSTSLAPALLMTFGHPGNYSVRLMIDGKEHFRASFVVRQG